MSNILNQHECAQKIESVIKGAVANEADLHQVAYSTLDHIRAHGNYTGALRLLNGLPRGLRVKGLAEWYKGFSNKKFVPGLDPKTKQWKAELAKDRTDADFDIEGAIATTYADYTTEPNYSTLSFEKFVKGLKRTATNTGFFPGTTIPKVSEDTRAVAMKLVQFLQTEAKAAMTVTK